MSIHSALSITIENGRKNMKKVIICGMALAFLMTTGSMAMAEVDKGPKEITIVNKDSKKPKPAQFPHAKHQERLKCGECHHGKSADGKQIPYKEGQKIEKCVTCHTGDMLKGKVKGKTALQRAGHGNCLACHKEEAKKDPKKKNLKKCSTCHPKKKK